MSEMSSGDAIYLAARFNSEFEFAVRKAELGSQAQLSKSQFRQDDEFDPQLGVTQLEGIRRLQKRLNALGKHHDDSTLGWLNRSNQMAADLVGIDGVFGIISHDARQQYRSQLIQKPLQHAVRDWILEKHAFPNIFEQWDKDDLQEFLVVTHDSGHKSPTLTQREKLGAVAVLIHTPTSGMPPYKCLLHHMIDSTYCSLRTNEFISCCIEIHAPADSKLNPTKFMGLFGGSLDGDQFAKSISDALEANGNAEWMGKVEAHVDRETRHDRIIHTAWVTVMPKGSYEIAPKRDVDF